MQDKIEAYEEELKQTPEYKTLYRYGNNKLHYGYFDIWSNLYGQLTLLGTLEGLGDNGVDQPGACGV